MLFEKSDLRPVDMAIWIDTHAYDKDVDEQKMFEYISHLVEMVARKGRYFKSDRDYDDFTSFATIQIFKRYRNKRQFKENPTVERVKSVLNLIKKTLRFYKIDYQNEEFYQKELLDNDKKQVIHPISYNQDNLSIDFCMYIKEIDIAIDKLLSIVPMSRNTLESQNIKISVLLSFLNQITFTKSQQIKMSKCSEEELRKKYFEDSSNNIILFHLNEAYISQVKVYVKLLQRYLATEITELIASFQEADDIISAMSYSYMKDCIEGEEE